MSLHSKLHSSNNIIIVLTAVYLATCKACLNYYCEACFTGLFTATVMHEQTNASNNNNDNNSKYSLNIL